MKRSYELLMEAQQLLGLDAATLEIRAIEVTDNATGDAPMMACLMEQMSLNESIASVSGDYALIRKGVMKSLCAVMHTSLFQGARTLSCGRTNVLAPKPETLSFMLHAA